MTVLGWILTGLVVVLLVLICLRQLWASEPYDDDDDQDGWGRGV